ncbi:hypothetical protein BJ944DRAFT_117404 [Cunninghamella echinulata]|nr:hypothetical protein BJ944DRAFT_117404 [Cunninghamella echinulata]
MAYIPPNHWLYSKQHYRKTVSDFFVFSKDIDTTYNIINRTLHPSSFEYISSASWKNFSNIKTYPEARTVWYRLINKKLNSPSSITVYNKDCSEQCPFCNIDKDTNSSKINQEAMVVVSCIIMQIWKSTWPVIIYQRPFITNNIYKNILEYHYILKNNNYF